MKNKTIYVCTECGMEHPAWSGQCSSCKAWNTLKAFHPGSKSGGSPNMSLAKTTSPKPLMEVASKAFERIPTANREVNRVIGGGWTPGSINLLAGQPGIGKSTLALQLLLDHREGTTLYISGEESAMQVNDRALRLGDLHPSLLFYNGTELESIIEHCDALEPELVVIDSIQTIYMRSVEGAPGGITQIRSCTQQIIQYAKDTHTPIILIGHITKDGSIGGPKLLEHMVDVVILFEGDPLHHYRILRCQKNRFGSTHEIGFFEMKNRGLIIVDDPSSISHHQQLDLPGNATSIVNQGLRSFIIQAQALVSKTNYGHPQRSPNGYDLRRMQMLIAVLERHGGLSLANFDVFINVAGSLKTHDTALDLAVAAACISTYLDIVLPSGHIFCGEVGLSGEIRAVRGLDRRIQEAAHRGYRHILTAKHSINKQDLPSNITITELKYISDLVQYLQNG